MRRFGILDGMILVAAAASGLALVRVYIADVEQTYRSSSINRPYVVKEQAVGSLVCILAPLTFAVLTIRFRSPRPPGVLRQPGGAGVAVAAVLLAYEVASVVTLVAYFTWAGRGPFGYSWYFLSRWWESVGPAVLACWLTLRWRRGEKPPADWVERAAMAVAGAWVALHVAARVAGAIW